MVAGLGLLVLAGCNSGTNSGMGTAPPAPQHGQLLTNPPTLLASYSAADLLGLLGVDPLGRELLTLAYSPVCTINVFRLQYETVGAQSEPATTTGALMVPSGSGSSCQGPRPIVEYAHGTSPDKQNLRHCCSCRARIASSEGLLLAALFAAEGYIVVAAELCVAMTAPRLGYSPLSPVGAQQADDMMDALTAARSALPVTPKRRA